MEKKYTKDQQKDCASSKEEIGGTPFDAYNVQPSAFSFTTVISIQLARTVNLLLGG
jgi:hypothetical protein